MRTHQTHHASVFGACGSSDDAYATSNMTHHHTHLMHFTGGAYASHIDVYAPKNIGGMHKGTAGSAHADSGLPPGSKPTSLSHLFLFLLSTK